MVPLVRQWAIGGGGDVQAWRVVRKHRRLAPARAIGEANQPS
uniref:Uncharacterized protein n=1 Tax=Marseillevirus LCMAC102 TaxID=2506603 RepID=A0A481YTN8_9VIRU|nr:MAG: hypothetical protein LCMAC102_03730 [Marseillevirus LCMAC102]